MKSLHGDLFDKMVMTIKSNGSIIENINHGSRVEIRFNETFKNSMRRETFLIYDDDSLILACHLSTKGKIDFIFNGEQKDDSIVAVHDEDVITIETKDFKLECFGILS